MALHPLRSTWTLWVHLQTNPDWTLNGYVRVCDVSSVEEMATAVEMLPESFVRNAMVFVMRKDVPPIWESKENCQGGAFSYKVTNKFVVESWRHTVYAMCGETLSKNQGFMDGVVGVSISPKKNFCIIKVWMRSSTHQNPRDITAHIRGIAPTGCIFKRHADR